MTTQSFADKASEASQEQGSSFSSEGKVDQTTQVNEPTDKVEAVLQKYEKRLHDKDDFIETLKAEKREVAEKLSKYERELNELKERLEAQGQTSEKVDKALQELAQKREVGSNDNAGVNLDEVIERATAVMEEKLTAKQRAEAEAENFRKVEAAVKEAHGDKYIDAVSARCTELGMSLVELDRLAKVSPQAALDLLKLKPQGTAKPTGGSVNTAAFKEQAQQQKPKTVMGMSDTKTDVAYWRSIGDRLKQ